MNPNYKMVSGTVPWHCRTEWLWPKSDNHLIRALKERPQDTIDALPHLQRLCKAHRTCIQAGGAMGVWPIGLSSVYGRVVTFEPHPDNYHCLLHNTAGIDGIECIRAALGSKAGSVDMVTPGGEDCNSGAYYVKSGQSVDMVSIDSLGLTDVDLIYLDVEGAENDAILGAADTIAHSRPVIGIEDKGRFYQRFGHSKSAVALLIHDFGYKIAFRPSRLDVILVPNNTVE